jgi:hypothetical protein
MSRKKHPNGPPEGPWAWISLELLASDAWRSLGINERRLIDFLQLEFMAKAGTNNGKLKAPHDQLVRVGIGAKYVAPAIRKAEDLGLVDAHRGFRVATTFALTWLPLNDGTPASHRWRRYRNPNLKPLSKPKVGNLPDKREAAAPDNGKPDGPLLPHKGEAD